MPIATPEVYAQILDAAKEKVTQLREQRQEVLNRMTEFSTQAEMLETYERMRRDGDV